MARNHKPEEIIGTDRRFRGIRPRDILRHRLARRFAPVDAADQHP